MAEQTESGVTERTWPIGAFPTPVQLADWLTRCADEERVALCARMLDSAQRAARCFEMDHDGLQAAVDSLRRVRDEAYRRHDAQRVAVDSLVSALDNARDRERKGRHRVVRQEAAQ